MNDVPDKYSLLSELATAKETCVKNVDKLLDARPNFTDKDKIDRLIIELCALQYRVDSLYGETNRML
jgi:hypothetical protein